MGKMKHLVYHKKSIGVQKNKIFWSIWHKSMIASVLSYIKQHIYSPLSIHNFNILLIL